MLFRVKLLPLSCVFCTVMSSCCDTAAVRMVYVTPVPLGKLLCLGFALTNHIARNHIDKSGYRPS